MNCLLLLVAFGCTVEPPTGGSLDPTDMTSATPTTTPSGDTALPASPAPVLASPARAIDLDPNDSVLHVGLRAAPHT